MERQLVYVTNYYSVLGRENIHGSLTLSVLSEDNADTQVALLQPYKDPNSAKSYCSISLLWSTCKLFEQRIMGRIVLIVEGQLVTTKLVSPQDVHVVAKLGT